MSGEGTPEGFAPPRRHGLHELGLVQLPLEVQHHHQAAAAREVHFGSDRMEERPADVTGGADEIRLADLEPDRVRAPVVGGRGDVRFILGHLSGVIGVGQAGDIDSVRDIPTRGAGDDRPPDAERPLLVVAGCRGPGTRQLPGSGRGRAAGACHQSSRQSDGQRRDQHQPPETSRQRMTLRHHHAPRQ